MPEDQTRPDQSTAQHMRRGAIYTQLTGGGIANLLPPSTDLCTKTCFSFIQYCLFFFLFFFFLFFTFLCGTKAFFSFPQISDPKFRESIYCLRALLRYVSATINTLLLPLFYVFSVHSLRCLSSLFLCSPFSPSFDIPLPLAVSANRQQKTASKTWRTHR